MGTSRGRIIGIGFRSRAVAARSVGTAGASPCGFAAPLACGRRAAAPSLPDRAACAAGSARRDRARTRPAEEARP